MVFVWDSLLIFRNSTRFSREAPGFPLSDFWKHRGVCRLVRPPQALDFVRPDFTNILTKRIVSQDFKRSFQFDSENMGISLPLYHTYFWKDSNLW